MTDIKMLLDLRSQHFIDVTNQLLDDLQLVLLSIQSFLETTKKEEYISGFFVWEDVSLIDEDTLLLLGIWQYDIGTILTVNNTSIEVTESTLQYFQRVIRVGLPIGLVDATSEEILEFLHQEQEQWNDVDDEVPNIKVEPISTATFELDDLTQEQQDSFKMFGFKGGNS